MSLVDWDLKFHLNYCRKKKRKMKSSPVCTNHSSLPRCECLVAVGLKLHLIIKYCTVREKIGMLFGSY